MTSEVASNAIFQQFPDFLGVLEVLCFCGCRMAMTPLPESCHCWQRNGAGETCGCLPQRSFKKGCDPLLVS